MKFYKIVSDGYNCTSLFFKKTFSIKGFKSFIIFTLGFLFFGCNPIALINPKSYGDKWDNTYLWFEPKDMDMIYISDTADRNTAKLVPNDSEFLIEWDKKEKVYNLKITSYYKEIDYAWFTGYDAENNSEEIPWVQEGNTIELQSTKLRVLPEGVMYQVSISDDLRD